MQYKTARKYLKNVGAANDFVVAVHAACTVQNEIKRLVSENVYKMKTVRNASIDVCSHNVCVSVENVSRVYLTGYEEETYEVPNMKWFVPLTMNDKRDDEIFSMYFYSEGRVKP